MLEIIRAGIMTSVQDLGREGFRRLGISKGGALDEPSMQIANMLVGNQPDEAVLEITFGQCQIRFWRDGWLALTGADCDAMLGEQVVWPGWRIRVKAGQQLILNIPKRGMRSYLAISGGIAVNKILGSRTTDLKAGFGGWQGRLLKDGDILPVGEPTSKFSTSVGVQLLPFGNHIRALAGPEYKEFSTESQNTFWQRAWQLTPQSNRMGFRLHGYELKREVHREMLSHGLIPGTVQVPHNGQPIVLMSDAQTTGGYPRIACVIEADLYQLSQIRLGEKVYFVRCTLAEAREAKLLQQRAIQKIKWGLNENRSEC